MITIGNVVISGNISSEAYERIVVRSLNEHYAAGKSMDMEVHPGQGTEYITKTWSEAYGFNYVTVRSTFLIPDDVVSMPYLAADGSVAYAKRNVRKAFNIPTDKFTVIVLDEWKSAIPKVKAALETLEIENAFIIRKSYADMKDPAHS